MKFLIGGGLFGMMVMVWYAVFLYPTYFGYDPVVDFGGYDGYYLAVNIWLMTSFVLFYTGYPILRVRSSACAPGCRIWICSSPPRRSEPTPTARSRCRSGGRTSTST